VGLSRDTFYRDKAAIDEGGVDALFDKTRRIPNYKNGFVESFNRRLRDECLNEHLLTSYSHVRDLIEAWRTDYYTRRPHTNLAGLTPIEFEPTDQTMNRTNF